jgi:hypothetical protein
MLMQIVLTVAESKRLVAKGVAAQPVVKRALKEGMLIIARGSTNGYVAEEILGRAIDKPAFLTGRTLPRGHVQRAGKSEPIGEIVIRRGEVAKDVTLAQAISDLGPGDVFIKGANALDYANKLAGILIGHPEGGTIGAALPTIIARKAHLIVPVGLEKLVASELAGMSELIASDRSGPDAVSSLWVIAAATIVTEIEAVESLTGAECRHLASGGIGGAEGSVRLLVWGDREAIGRARTLFDSIAGEEPYPI